MGFRLEKLLYFDYCGLVVTVVLIISTLYRGLTKGRVNRTLFFMMLLRLFTNAADIFAVWFDNMGPGNRIIKYFWHSMYLTLHSIYAPLYLLYLRILADTDYKMKKMNKVLFYFPFLVMFSFLATNPIHKRVF